jgi:RNA polymerase sigma-70 factor (ECF subfamily)
VQPDDDGLMGLLARGEVEVLGELYLRHDNMVRGAIRRFAPEMPEAEMEEVTQEVFMLLFDKAKKYEASGRFKAFLYSIAVRKARSWRRDTWLRRKLLQGAPGEQLHLGQARPEAPSQQFAMREAIDQILERLPGKQREVLLLHTVEGFSGDEIARILNISEKTVRTRLFRSRQAILRNVNREVWQQALPMEVQ